MKATICHRVVAGLVLCTAIFGPLALVSHGWSAGPPAGATGAPGDGNCGFCHNTYPIDSGPATLTISGLPSLVSSGGHYPLTVTLTGATGTKYGFEIVAKKNYNVSVGTWTVTMPGKTQSPSGYPAYHEQTALGNTQTSWNMTWDAPTVLGGGPVCFYAAAVDGNGNGSDSGDQVYTTKAQTYRLAFVPGGNIPCPMGGPFGFTISGGSEHAANYCALVASDDPHPYALGGGLELAVTPNYLYFSVQPQFPTIFQNFSGFLDASGQATPALDVPIIPALAGFQLHVGAVLYSFASQSVTEVSDRQTLTLQ